MIPSPFLLVGRKQREMRCHRSVLTVGSFKGMQVKHPGHPRPPCRSESKPHRQLCSEAANDVLCIKDSAQPAQPACAHLRNSHRGTAAGRRPSRSPGGGRARRTDRSPARGRRTSHRTRGTAGRSRPWTSSCAAGTATRRH